MIACKMLKMFVIAMDTILDNKPGSLTIIQF